VSSATEGQTVVVPGARGLVGRYLLPLLAESGFAVLATSRHTVPAEGAEPGVRWVALDLERPAALPERLDLLVHAAPIWLLPPWLPRAADAGVRRVVAFSSTSRFTKRGSGSPRERETAERIASAEQAVQETCRDRDMRWTILRPTLVYGGGLDRNVSDVARFVRRFGFFPVAGSGRGLRQPVHASDLARAVLAVLDRPATFDRAYETPGGETLAYAAMGSRIAGGVGREPRLLRVPLPLLRGVLSVARHLPGFGHLTPEMADRMDEDLVFDVTAARRDFGYDPRPFRFPDEPEARNAP
jgi:nucleoside-diphosphate-sugar epimerase